MELTFKLNQKEDCFLIRQRVFVEEQGFQHEFDDLDECCTFITAYTHQQCIGCARMIEDKQNSVVLGRVAVLSEYRGMQVGKQLIHFAEQIAKKQGNSEMRLHAQCIKQGFYERLGYSAYGDIEWDEHVEHIWMKKRL